ncbi:hypothetical protein [Nostoc commune]|nr:hypothetical protein [Nostoc commune]
MLLLGASGKNMEVQTFPFMIGLTFSSSKYCIFSDRSNLEYLDFS